MNIEAPSLNALWADLIVAELVRNGVDYFCLAPGSRNSPLTIAVAQNEQTRGVIHYDERGVAFHALGWGRATRRPAVVICTSGTAAGNLLPAVIEASMDMVPLIILTADRPPELRHTGGNQTIDQVKLFGDYVRWFYDMPCPDESIDPEVVLTTVDQAVYRMMRSPAGPVHINCMFREPLAPPRENEDFTSYLWSLGNWWDDITPYTDYPLSKTVLTDEMIGEVAETLSSDEGIVIVGRLHCSAEHEAVRSFVQHLNWPVFPDIGSGLRLGNDIEHAIVYYDQLMLSEDLVESWYSSPVIHIGGVPTSKRLQQFLTDSRPSNYIMVANHPYRHDPGHRVSVRLETDITAFCERIIPRVKKKGPTAWLDDIITRSQAVNQALKEVIDDCDTMSEPAVARLISQHIRPDSGLFLANSMPIRDMDMYTDASGPAVIVGCNRGASGIDGTIASASGFAAGLNRPTTLVIGDLAFLHDLNSLALLTSLKRPLVIVVINNNGGGVFSFLPVAGMTDLFEPYFGTPHGYTFEKAAEMFGLDYACPDSKESFISVYQSRQQEDRSAIIEVSSDRQENYRIHREIEEKVKAVLNEL